MRNEFRKVLFALLLTKLTICSFSQGKSSDSFPEDSTLMHASVSMCVADAETGNIIMEYNSGNSLTPASVMKVITSAAVIELLGPEYIFKTKIGYTGTLRKWSGRLKGNIIITGGGDPALGSKYFADHYHDFLNTWAAEISKVGIKKVKGRIITDDSYYDFLPVPAKWLLEDEGNYYGAGAYGLSAFDNTYEIHFKTLSDSIPPIITEFVPGQCRTEFSNFLIASDSSEEGCVYSAPYSTTGWLAGKIPVKQNDYMLKASISDPPLLVAKMMTDKLKSRSIKVTGNPTTVRSEKNYSAKKIVPITETLSPLLTDIIEVMNHESVNLYAEHLIKELGKKFKNNGSTASGIEVINEFLKKSGINTNGLFIVDGSGLSPQNALNTGELVHLLVYMKTRSKYFREYYSSFPDAGKEGTMKNYFKDSVFDSRLKAKSGSMTRVQSFAGYFTTHSGKQMAFSIIINNYTGPSKNIISGIEEIIGELITKN